MAHHGSQGPSGELRKAFEGMSEHLGGTGKFPRGMVDGSDEGELAFGVAVKDGTVILNFNKPVAWMGMDADQARQMGQLLFEKAREIDGRQLAITIG